MISLRLSRVVRCRVLQLDDNPDVADSQGLRLECLGAASRVAYDGETALGTSAEFKPHVVILDIDMPGMDGCETARSRYRDGVTTTFAPRPRKLLYGRKSKGKARIIAASTKQMKISAIAAVSSLVITQ